MDRPGEDILRSIKDNMTPATDKMAKYDPLPLLQMLRQLVGGKQQAPGLNERLPRFGGMDERGQPVIIPGDKPGRVPPSK